MTHPVKQSIRDKKRRIKQAAIGRQKSLSERSTKSKPHALTLVLIEQHRHLTTVINTAVETLHLIANLPPRCSKRARRLAESTLAFLQTQSEFVKGNLKP